MPVQSLEAVYRSLKRAELSPVYYLTGAIDLLKDELASAIANAAVDETTRAFNFDVRSASELDGEALHALIETPPMFAPRRVVVVKGLEQWRANATIWQVLFRYLEHPSPTTVLILIQAGEEKPLPRLAAAGTHVAIDSLSPEHLRRWIAARSRKSGIEIAPEAVEHLIGAVGGELGPLAMEIEKIAAALPAGATVSVDQVASLAGVRRGETLMEWVDAALRRDTVAAMSLLDVVLPQPGVNGVRMATALGTALLGTRAARAFLDQGSSSNATKDELFQFLRQTRPQGVGSWSEETKLWIRRAPEWTGEELERALNEVFEADRALKSSTLTDERGVLASLLLRIGRSAARSNPGVAA